MLLYLFYVFVVIFLYCFLMVAIFLFFNGCKICDIVLSFFSCWCSFFSFFCLSPPLSPITGLARGLSSLSFFKEVLLGFIDFIISILCYYYFFLLYHFQFLYLLFSSFYFDLICYPFSGSLIWRPTLIIALSSFIIWAFEATHFLPNILYILQILAYF